MANVITLLGAGFSKNWNGLLAADVTTDLMSRLQDHSDLLDVLKTKNFEDVLYQLQAEFLLLGKSKYPPHEVRLTAFEAALSSQSKIDLVINTMDGRGEVLVGKLRSTVADDEIAIGEGVGIMINHHVPPRSLLYLNHP
jgi:hypothetical protein